VEVTPRQKELKQGERLSVFGAVTPVVASAPIALHLVSPSGKRIVERTRTNASGQFAHVFTTALSESGGHQLVAFVLKGTDAGEAESAPVVVHVP
jgi:hypothetical protein